MRKIYIFVVFLAAFAILFQMWQPPAEALSTPELRAASALIAEAGNGQVLFEKNKDARVQPGGLVKIMTLLIAVEEIESGRAQLDDVISVSHPELKIGVLDGAGERPAPGDATNLGDQMFRAYLTASEDACKIIARHLAGSEEAFVSRMNREAGRLGCAGTRFANADGAADNGQYSTAWDQYLIFREAVGHPMFLHIAGTHSYQMSPTEDSPPVEIWNSNLMLYRDTPYYSKAVTAGRKDDTTPGNQSHVSCAKSDSITVISVVFGSAAPDDAAADNARYTDTKKLIDWAFSNFSWHTVLNKNDIIAREDIGFAVNTDSVELRPAQSMTVLARSDLTPADIRREITLFAQIEGKQLTAPVREGDILGEVTVVIDGAVCGKTRLVALRSVELNRVEFMKAQVRNTLSNPWVKLGAVLLALLLVGYVALVAREYIARRRRRKNVRETRRRLIEERRRAESLQEPPQAAPQVWLDTENRAD